LPEPAFTRCRNVFLFKPACMETTFEKAESFTATMKAYIDAKVELMKMNVAEKISAVVANTIAGMVAAVVFLFFLLLGSVALALWLGEITNRLWLGFLITAAFYGVLGLVVWMLRERLIRLPIMNALIKQLFKNDETDS
jgi:uncharacterized membrane protein YqjE